VKRKVKFQEGGAVETPSQRRVRLSESFRDRALEYRDAMRREAAARAADQRAIAQFNERMNRAMPVTAAEARALGAEPAQRPANPRPNVAQRAAGAAGAVARGASRAVPGMNVVRGVTPTSLQAGADFEQEGLRRARMVDERSRMEQRMGEAGDRLPTSPPASAPTEASRPEARPRPAPRPARPPAPRPREMTADELNELELRRILAERRMEEEPIRASRQEERGGSGDIGAASARARGEQVGPPGDYNMKKGGMVKAKPVAKKAGGMIKPAPKKMMKGGVVAKPKAKAKSMPAFKKGGAVKKGKK